jgi:methyl-accepting chemotaxis protein
LVGGAIWLLGRSVARPLRDLAAVTERLSRGDLTVSVEGVGRTDEFGALARSLEVLKGNSMERVRLERVAEDRRAAKDRRQTAMDGVTNDFGEVISGVLTGLTHAARTMGATARAMTDGTERTRDSVTRTAQGSAASSHDLSAVAAATARLSASVDEIARQVGHASDATRDAVDRTAETDATFLRLSSMAGQIGDVGGAIASIAAQTNLLALNATIEAARAGEAGKGFSVVANEVKALAAQTARATAEIGEKVTAIQGATETTALAIRDVGAAVGRVDSVSAAIAAAIEQQGATTREIATTVQNIAQTSELSAAAMKDVALIADGAGAMCQGVLTASDDIAKVAVTLRDEVDQFLRTMAQDDGYQRRYERIPGNDTQATLEIRDGPRVQALVQDISRGGAALRCSAPCVAGDEVAVVLPGMRVQAGARVVRSGAGTVAIAFQQDDGNLAAVDTAIDLVREAASPRKAA